MRISVPPTVLASWQKLVDAAARLLSLRAALVIEATADPERDIVRVASHGAPFEVDGPLPDALTVGPHESLDITAEGAWFGSLRLLHQGDRRFTADEHVIAVHLNTLIVEHLALVVQQRRQQVRDSDAREHDDRYLFAVEASRTGLWDFDAATGRLYCDARWYEIFGFDPATFTPTINTYEEVVHPDDRPLAMQERLRAFSSDLFEFTDHRIVRPSGEIRWIRTSTRRIRRHDGRAPRLVGVVRDITANRSSREELRRLSERMRLATEVAGIGVWEIDLVNDTFVSDDQMHRIYELSPAEMTLANWRRRIHPDDRKRLKETWLAAYAGDGRFASEFRVCVPSGETRYVRCVAQVFFDAAHRPIRIVGTNAEITAERVARVEAEAAAKSKSDFLANMSHEIRTPMNAVVAFAGMLVDTPLTASQREMVRAMKIGADHLMSVLNDVLDLSHIMAGQVELERRAFALRRCIEDCLDLVAAQAAEKDLSLTYGAGDDVPEWIVGDEPRLRQVLLNLLANAVKFTNRGAVSVVVARAGGDLLSVEVHDTGIGIPADRMDRLFQEFSQVDTSTRREFGGTGLGLAISKRLCELMGGSIGATSLHERGSIFTFTIVAPAAPSVTAAMSEVRHLPPDLRVLVVDDSAPDRMLLTSALRSWGIDVTALEGPREALVQLWSGARYDLAVLDYRMPEMSGLELASELQRIPGVTTMPIVLISAYALHAPEVRAAAVPIGGILTKPVRQSTLFDTLADCLNPRDGVTAEAPVATVKPPLRILLVEDNPVNQRVALLMLERLGYAAEVASGGAQGVQLATSKSYDVVLMDVQMPDLDGLEATRIIRAHYAARGARGPRIVAMTAHALASDREMCFAAGMDGYISKPIDQHRLAVELAPPPTTQRSARPEPIVQFQPQASIVETLGEDGIREVVAMFIDTTPKALSEMQQAIAANDRRNLTLQAHSLRSVCQMLGALDMAAACNRIEHGKHLDMAELALEVQGLGPLFDGAIAGLARFLAR